MQVDVPKFGGVYAIGRLKRNGSELKHSVDQQRVFGNFINSQYGLVYQDGQRVLTANMGLLQADGFMVIVNDDENGDHYTQMKQALPKSPQQKDSLKTGIQAMQPTTPEAMQKLSALLPQVKGAELEEVITHAGASYRLNILSVD